MRETWTQIKLLRTDPIDVKVSLFRPLLSSFYCLLCVVYVFITYPSSTHGTREDGFKFEIYIYATDCRYDTRLLAGPRAVYFPIASSRLAFYLFISHSLALFFQWAGSSHCNLDRVIVVGILCLFLYPFVVMRQCECSHKQKARGRHEVTSSS